jgi:hypothetical protein
MESSLLTLVRLPDSVGQFRQYGLEPFDPEDVAYAQSLGFDISAPVPNPRGRHRNQQRGLTIRCSRPSDKPYAPLRRQ